MKSKEELERLGSSVALMLQANNVKFVCAISSGDGILCMAEGSDVQVLGLCELIKISHFENKKPTSN